nr:immunoglobulin light chain junction region [Macaca mulatta]MOX48062.1 immunoglobulin light chain junction region [Macaca mulatta]MOX48237.1 immunoglobulin light chain junction region [Macaca mulatta]MOX48308.1 immunoglobulin light chain junction region [Macaca mulatta]MOX49278.1 immunoglobulin light chain junction region [Macaca mulatta]
CQQETEWPRTF